VPGPRTPALTDTPLGRLGARLLRMRKARELLGQGRERSTSPFHDFGLSRGVRWLEPMLHVEVTYSELMQLDAYTAI